MLLVFGPTFAAQRSALSSRSPPQNGACADYGAKDFHFRQLGVRAGQSAMPKLPDGGVSGSNAGMDLSLITVAWSAISAACLTVALMYSGVWLKQSRQITHLVFAVLAFSVAAIALCELLLMRESSPQAYGAIMQWMHVPVFVLTVS